MLNPDFRDILSSFGAEAVEYLSDQVPGAVLKLIEAPMTTDFVATLLTTQFLLSFHPALPDPCGLVSSTEIASALGTKPSSGRTVGPSVDVSRSM